MAAGNQSLEKLQKKLDKDPNSLIFVQLVEEYRKEGNFDAALKVCQEGLRRHPNYWSARVALGRIHHQMRNSELARQELERVIQAVPDNLLANRLLGDIYLNSGNLQDALKRYRIVQMLTPNDPEVLASIERIEAQETSRESEPQLEVETQVQIPAEEASELEDTWSGVNDDSDQKQDEAAEPATQLEAKTLEIRSPQAQESEVPVPEPSVHETIPDVEEIVQSESDFSSAVDFSALDEPGTQDQENIEDIAAMFLQSDDQRSAELDSPEAVEDDFMSPHTFSTIQMEPETAPGDPLAFSTVEMENPEPEFSSRESYPEVEDAEELTTETLAELYVKQGLNDKAIKVYEKLLLMDPGNHRIEERLKELSRNVEPEPEQIPEEILVHDTFEIEESFGGEVKLSQSEDHFSSERQRKIATLESWLATIRRDRKR